jgi:stearoyl-CoA desaturase (delta-9 desaturase)
VLPPPLAALLVAFATAQLATFATTVYLHRALSHRAIALHPGVSFAFRVVLWLTTGIKARQWVAVHRKHHAHTDVEGDPHSPRLLGWRTVQVGNVGLYRAVANDEAQVRQYARDLPADRWDRAVLDRGWLGLALGLVTVCVALGPLWGLLAALVHGALYLQLNAAVNAITHTFGERPHENGATNLQSLALVTSGEGLHNNHHHAPYSAKLSFRRGEVDPAWPAIALLRRLGLAAVKHTGPHPTAARTSEPEPVPA